MNHKSANKIKVLVIAGTRPEIIKLGPMIKLLSKEPEFSLIFMYSGQHYDKNLYHDIINDMKIIHPHQNIEVGSGSHGYQIGYLIQKIEEQLNEIDPNIVIAQGDTNTTLAAALASEKANKLFMHLEAGIRSFDKTMPEEINRMLIANCTKYHLAPTERAGINLLFEGIHRKSIFIVGNTIVDAINMYITLAEKKSKIFKKLGIKDLEKIILVTLHRPSNVDNRDFLLGFIKTVKTLKDYKFIFPIHPRTMKNLKRFGIQQRFENIFNIILIPPIKYLDFLYILSKSMCVITDSGGIQEEASILRIPCVTLRNNTERPETIEYNSNILIGNDMKALKLVIEKISKDPTYLKGKNQVNPFGDGKTSRRTLEIFKKIYSNKNPFYERNYLWNKIPERKLKIIRNLDNPINVSTYETMNNEEIQIIFDKNGMPFFPYESTLLYEGFSILINER